MLLPFPFPFPVPLPKPNALSAGVDGLLNADCGCAGPFEVLDEGSPNADFWNANAGVDEVLVPDEEFTASSFFPKEKTEGVGFDGAPKIDGFELSADLAALPNDEVPCWMLPNATGDPAGVVEKGLLDTPLPNALLGVVVDIFASPLGSGALDFPKAPFVPKLELPNTDAGVDLLAS